MRHELHLVLRGLIGLAVALPVGAGLGYAVGGRAVAGSVLIGVGLVAANQAVAALSTGWARTLTTGVLAAGYAIFVLRMLAVLTAFAYVASWGWVHRPAVAISFCAALVVALTTECLSYVRRSYVPAWRTVT